jgi:hypothetical protein
MTQNDASYFELGINAQSRYHLSFTARNCEGRSGFLALNRLNPDSGFTCEHDDESCDAPAWCLLSIADAPELLNEPDTYRLCRLHAGPQLDSFMLTLIDD